MRNEIQRRKGPQGHVQFTQQRRLTGHGHLRACAGSLAQQPAGIAQLVRRVEMELDPGHCAAEALRLDLPTPAAPSWRDRRYWNSRPTGRPVAPLFAPLLQAVPAISRW